MAQWYDLHMPSREQHWQEVHHDRDPSSVSWHQETPSTSLSFVAHTGAAADQPLVDVGGGVSNLVDHLLEQGFTRLAVADISSAALDVTKDRLGSAADEVAWIVGDVTEADLGGPYRVWHDRAVFHFLTEPEQRRRYRAQLLRYVEVGGHVIIATFAEDGPTRCSGLPVMRYDATAIAAELGTSFELLRSEPSEHTTPSGSVQRFRFNLFVRRADRR